MISREPVYVPPEHNQWINLLDGRQALIRPIYSSDKDALRAFFDRLSLDTRILRFHYAKTTITEDELDFYCKIDYNRILVLIAEMQLKNQTSIVGLGHYHRLPYYQDAEVAFVVEDKEQGNGIGTNLLKELAFMAKQRSITTFVAEVVSYNAVMLDIFRKYNPALKRVLEGSSYRVTFSV